MKEDIDINWLEEYAEQEKKYKWGKEIKKLIKGYKELEEERDNLIIQKNADYYKISKIKDDLDEVEGDRDYNYIPKSKVRKKIEKLNKRIDYLDKELAEAYIQREKLGTETELDSNEQYIYNMEQERSIRHTEKYAYLKLLEGDK